MKRKKALMACGNYWTSPFQVGSHHIAQALVELGWDVAFISAPISPLHLLDKTDLRHRFGIYKKGGENYLNGRLWSYVPGAFFVPYNAPFLRSRWIHQNWWRLTLPNLVKKVKENGFSEIDLLYLDSFIQPFWLDNLKYDKSILRITDNFASFGMFAPAALESEKRIAEQVDLVVYTAQSLESHVMSLRPKKVKYLPNGVNFSYFANSDQTLPEEYKYISKPRVIYLGAIQFWFDYDLIIYAARQLPKVSFVLIGPDDLARTRLKILPNLYILGARPYSKVPSYIFHADVGIMPLNVKDYPSLVNNIHPLKLYEYMACGIPVVSVEWDELVILKSPAILCRTADEFIEGISKAISCPGDPNERVRFAKNADWLNRVSTLIENLG